MEFEYYQNASFEPLTAVIGPTGRPVMLRMKPKKKKKKQTPDCDKFTYAQPRPFAPTDAKFTCG